MQSKRLLKSKLSREDTSYQTQQSNTGPGTKEICIHALLNFSKQNANLLVSCCAEILSSSALTVGLQCMWLCPIGYNKVVCHIKAVFKPQVCFYLPVCYC